MAKLDPSVSPESDALPTFRTRNLTKVYQTGDVAVHALRGVNLDISKSEIVALLGPSGSGKSTLLNIIGGLDTATAGDVFFRDINLTSLGPSGLTRYRRDNVGFVFQFYNLIPSLTARENVELVTELSKSPMRAADALDLVDMSNRLDHFPAQLSGGEQQRVAIARAIAKRPDVLLCDEPTGALDSEAGVLVLEVIERVNRELGTTCALITHNGSIAEMGDRIVRFFDGQIASDIRNAARRPPREIEW